MHRLFLTDSDRELVDQALTNVNELSAGNKDSLLSLFGTFGMFAMPNANNIRDIIIGMARHELLDAPAPLMELMRRGIPAVHMDTFWSSLSLPAIQLLFSQQLPTPNKVRDVLVAANEDSMQQDEHSCMHYLRQFVAGLDHDDLSTFLRYVTGSTVMPDKITVTFCKMFGLARRPIAHTCSNILELSSTYSSLQELSRQLNEFYWMLIVFEWT